MHRNCVWKICFCRLALCGMFILNLCGCVSEIPEETGNTVSETTLPESVAVSIPETTPETIPETEPVICDPVLTSPKNTDFVCVKDYIPEIHVELKYATGDNFTGQSIYAFEDAYLRYGTVQKLASVCADLKELGLTLKIWDGFRPVSAQHTLWKVYPDPVYVANPTVGFSSHSRGNTVDVAILDSEGIELEMPTGFDDFSAKADRDYSDCSETAAANAGLLESIMEKHGFRGYWGEWWHYTDTDSYDVETCFDPAVISQWSAQCEEYITLRATADTAAPEITRIPAGEEVTLLGYEDAFALVTYLGERGYVLKSYLSPAE